MFLQWKSGAAPTWHGVQLQMVPGGQPWRARGPQGWGLAVVFNA